MCAICFYLCFLGFSFLMFSNYRWRRWRTGLRRRIKANWSWASASGKEKKENESQENGASAHLLTPPRCFLSLHWPQDFFTWRNIAAPFFLSSFAPPIEYSFYACFFSFPFPLSPFCCSFLYMCIYIFLNWWETIYMRIYFCLHIVIYLSPWIG
jgi:hypothetical protein